MVQAQLEFDPALRVDAREIASLWQTDPQASTLLAGPPEVHRRRPGTYHLPHLIEYVVLPLATNVASTILIEVSARLYRRYRPDAGGHVRTTAEDAGNGDRIIVTEAEEAPGGEPAA